MLANPRKSSGQVNRKISSSFTSSSSFNSSRIFSSMVSSISSRTAGPNFLLDNSRSIASSKFSASSSSTSTSSFLVTRNVWCWSTSIPGNSASKLAEITSSSGTNLCPQVFRNLGNVGGTFTLANNSELDLGFRNKIAKFNERPEIYGNGCAGSTASGVNTGNILLLYNSFNLSISLSLRSFQRHNSISLVFKSGMTSL